MLTLGNICRLEGLWGHSLFLKAPRHKEWGSLARRGSLLNPCLKVSQPKGHGRVKVSPLHTILFSPELVGEEEGGTAAAASHEGLRDGNGEIYSANQLKGSKRFKESCVFCCPKAQLRHTPAAPSMVLTQHSQALRREN